ncbi:MAG: mechanosensitive ion channel family protein [Clostridia bacterium]
MAASSINGNLLSMEWPEVIDYLIRIGIVIIGIFIFFFIMRIMKKIIGKALDRKKVKNTFHSFIISIFKALSWIVITLVFLQILKVPLTPLIAVLGSLGIGLGLALKDHMSNIAGGIMIAINKQFEVGDYIKCGDSEGTVEDVELFFTRLRTFDNKIIYAPNSIFPNTSVFNYTREKIRRVDVAIGVAYSSGVEEVKQTILGLLAANDMVKKEPVAFVGITSYADSSINFIVRAWADTENYWTVYFYINDMLKKEFDKKGIAIPFPQLDVHIDK